MLGISHSGDDTENSFFSLTGANKTSHRRDGDAVLDGNFIEIKYASSFTLNQVRAVKYITLVAYHAPTMQWFVIPAYDVVEMASRKNRGQHTENPFESVTLSLRYCENFMVDEVNLRQSVLDAVDKSNLRPDLRNAMQDILVESRRLRDESLSVVRSLMTT